jgi:hypothetical protein
MAKFVNRFGGRDNAMLVDVPVHRPALTGGARSFQAFQALTVDAVDRHPPI